MYGTKACQGPSVSWLDWVLVCPRYGDEYSSGYRQAIEANDARHQGRIRAYCVPPSNGWIQRLICLTFPPALVPFLASAIFVPLPRSCLLLCNQLFGFKTVRMASVRSCFPGAIRLKRIEHIPR